MKKTTSIKRTDGKGRILKTGESQRKDGRYAYKYIDTDGKTKFLYSWKLNEGDPLPKGKRACIALREQEKDVLKDITDGINTDGKKMTLCQLYAKQNSLRTNVKKMTVTGRNALMDILKQDKLGNMSIDKIKPSDAKEWAIRLKKNGTAYTSVNNYKRSLKAAFYTAMEDDYVRKNPFNWNLSDVIEDDTQPKTPLTEEQAEALLSFTNGDETYKQYRTAIVVLLNTGIRISELCGLTVQDVDFEKGCITIDHQLLKDKDGYYINTPKTENSVRQIPMTLSVRKALAQEIKTRNPADGLVIDGYKDFIFQSKKGKPMYGCFYNSVFKGLVKKYNKQNKGNELPDISPHILRHTFCTNMANKKMTPTNLQYIMGHKNITMTLGYYAHGSFLSAQTEMEQLAS